MLLKSIELECPNISVARLKISDVAFPSTVSSFVNISETMGK